MADFAQISKQSSFDQSPVNWMRGEQALTWRSELLDAKTTAVSKTQTENEIVISWSDDHWNTEYDQLVSSHLMFSWPSASCCPADEMVVRSEGENLARLPFFPLLLFSGFRRYNLSFIFFLAMLSSFVLFGLFRVLLTRTVLAPLDGVFFILIFPFSLSLLCCLQIFLWFLLASWPPSNNWSCWSSLM